MVPSLLPGSVRGNWFLDLADYYYFFFSWGGWQTIITVFFLWGGGGLMIIIIIPFLAFSCIEPSGNLT